MINPFALLVRAFRAAVRTEVERSLADRRRALTLVPPTDEDIASIGEALAAAGYRPRSATILPFPANDPHSDTSPQPPRPAA